LRLPPSSPSPSDVIMVPTAPITPTSTRTLRREASTSMTPPQTSVKESKRREGKARRRALLQNEESKGREGKARRRALLQNEVATAPPRTPEKEAALLCAAKPGRRDAMTPPRTPEKEVVGQSLFENDWSQWVEVPGCSSEVLTCVNEEPLGLNTDGGTGGVVYVEDVRPGTWAARIQMKTPCKLLAVNGQDVQCLSEGAFNDMMQRRPVNITLKRLQMRKAPIGECSRSEEVQVADLSKAVDSRRRDRSRSRSRQQTRHPSIPSSKLTTDPVRVRSKPVLASKPSLMNPTSQPLGDAGQTKAERYRQKSLWEAFLMIQGAQGKENTPLPDGSGVKKPANEMQPGR